MLDRLKECRSTGILPPDENGGAVIGEGLVCPSTEIKDLPNPGCDRSFTVKISAAFFGSVKGDTTLIINSSVKATKNQRAVHTHQTKCDMKTQCAPTYTSWVVTLDTTLDVTTTVELGGTPITVNVSGTFGGANTDHTYSKTDPHPGDVKCGPEN